MKKFFLLISSIIILFQGCTSREKKDDSTMSEKRMVAYLDRGKDLANKAQKALGGQLIEAISKGGVPYAVQFCNIKAIPITDSLSNEVNANIHRVSDRPRNPENQANEHENKYISQAKALLSSGEKVLPSIQRQNDIMVGYYPIITNPLCLQCHGKPNETIANETWDALQKHYPKDKAFGYGPDEIRGIFVVEMPVSAK
ncbi:Tll0287-like domain-containing protein [Membranihabitans maritimus]|uniref:Tll0287-like domain-containing protein n=1 Tax=Membranihabitans maritimus TaxID=2904244 RepID=UPI001F225E4B|nr:DUF3365 domain-containing protein [Membranihabitans maritimus]